MPGFLQCYGKWPPMKCVSRSWQLYFCPSIILYITVWWLQVKEEFITWADKQQKWCYRWKLCYCHSKPHNISLMHVFSGDTGVSSEYRLTHHLFCQSCWVSRLLMFIHTDIRQRSQWVLLYDRPLWALWDLGYLLLHFFKILILYGDYR